MFFKSSIVLQGPFFSRHAMNGVGELRASLDHLADELVPAIARESQ
jgi:hypothetical protein